MTIIRGNEYSKYDFFSIESNFEKFRDIKSIKIFGDYNSKPPLLTVVIPTYRRVKLLKKTIESILNQIDYDDYQILIVDNQPTKLNEQDTEELIRSLNCNKIIYYRNQENIGGGNWNRCIELSKTKYICMIHDDDVLANNHLFKMMKIIKNNPKIRYLGCRHYWIDERNNEHNYSTLRTDVEINERNIIKFSVFDFNHKFSVPFLGAVFDRQAFIDLGGVSNILEIDDYILVAKFAYYYNVYCFEDHLYGYRWLNNDSMNLQIWQNALVKQYYLNRYITNKRSIVFRWFFKEYDKYNIITLLRKHNKGISFLHQKCDLDEEKLMYECNIKNINYDIVYFIKHIIRFKRFISRTFIYRLFDPCVRIN